MNINTITIFQFNIKKSTQFFPIQLLKFFFHNQTMKLSRLFYFVEEKIVNNFYDDKIDNVLAYVFAHEHIVLNKKLCREYVFKNQQSFF